MTANTPVINIACAFDDVYAPHFATLAASLAASLGQEKLHVWLLTGPGLSTDTLSRLETYLATLGIGCTSVQVPDAALAQLPATSRYPSLIWYRLLLPELLPAVQKVLYLDADILALQSLCPLYHLELGDHLLAAVGTATTGWEWHCQKLGLDPKQGYFNSGVLLMNLDAMRKNSSVGHALSVAKSLAPTWIFPDQDTLNVAFRDHWLRLAPKWNATSYFWLQPKLADRYHTPLECLITRHSPALVHFEGPAYVKPWHSRCIHPHREIYRGLRNQTPWPLPTLEGTTLFDALFRRIPLSGQRLLMHVKQKLV